MKKIPPLSNISKIWSLLLPRERHNSIILFFLMLIGVGLETLGVGLVIPALSPLAPFLKNLAGSPANRTG